MPRIEGPTVSRRAVVGGLCASGVLGVGSSSAAPDRLRETDSTQTATSSEVQGETLATGSMEYWSGLVGSQFTASGFRLKLTGVRALTTKGDRPPEVTREAAFLAVFEILSGGFMPGDLIYRMTSRKQVVDAFLANASTQEFPNNMHAVFN